jgi:hypothetical protein
MDSFSAALISLLLLWFTCDAHSTPFPPVDNAVVFMCADNGTFSGMNELHYIKRELTDVQDIPTPFCVQVSVGWFGKTQVLVVVTGIGAVNAALCSRQVFSQEGWSFRSAIYVGTSGMSPLVGGFEPSKDDGCRPATAVEPYSIGTVCVTSAALDLSCGICYSNATALPSECAKSHCVAHTRRDLFGQCVFSRPTELTGRILSAFSGHSLPDTPLEIKGGMKAWWGANKYAENGMVPTPTAPRLLSHCAEVDNREIVASGVEDYKCRSYAADLLGSTPSTTPCITAMEGIGFLQVTEQLTPSLPVAIIRAGSNYDMYPLYSLGGGRWAMNMTYISPSEYDAFTRAQYQYAVLTSNAVAIRYLIQSFGSADES